MNLSILVKRNEAFFNQLKLSAEDIVYAAELSHVVYSPPAQGHLKSKNYTCTDISRESSLCQGENAKDYFVKTAFDDIYIIKENMSYEKIDSSCVSGSASSESGAVIISLSFIKSNIQKADIIITADNMTEVFAGKAAQLLKDFDSEGNGVFDNMPDMFVRVKISVNSQCKAPSVLKPCRSLLTLISYNNNGIYMYNDKTGIGFEQILMYHKRSGYCCVVYEENNRLVFAEICGVHTAESLDLNANLIDKNTVSSELNFEIVFPENIIKANSSLALIKYKRLSLAICDGSTYILKNYSLVKCDIRKTGNDLYITSDDNTTVKYREYGEAADIMPIQPSMQ